MIKVQSLRNRIIVQFLVIIAPLASVPLILTWFSLQRAADLEHSFRLRQISLEATDAYKRFKDGVLDALDTDGALSRVRIANLDTVIAALDEQRRLDPNHSLDGTAESVDEIQETVLADSSSATIRALTPTSNRVDRDLADNRLRYEAQHEVSIANAIDGVRMESWVVLAATLVSALLAAFFVRSMILGLTRPLTQAISVANRIAGGEILGPNDVRTRPDLGGLLQSLARMNASLGDYRRQAKDHERLLESKITERTQELGRSVERLQALAEVSKAVNSTLDLQEVLETIVARAVELSATNMGAIYEFDEAAQELRLRAISGISSELSDVMQTKSLRIGEGATGRAAATQAPVDIADVDDPADSYDSPIRDVTDRAGVRAVLALPLLREGRVFGALTLARYATGRTPPEIIELLQTFAAQSTMAIQNARLFREIAQKSEELEATSAHKSQFLANMSHELRTPLNAILGYTELIVDKIYGEVPPKILSILERVQRSGRHLLDLINDVLDLSRIEAGQLTLSIKDYSFADMIHTVITSIEPLVAAKGLKLAVDIEPDLPVTRGDERRVAQVLINLLGNAVKFTDKGAVRVGVARSDGALLVSVSDTGPGIPEGDRQRIFQEFQQVDSSSTRAKGGAGLGLSIAKRIVEMHGGRLWVESARGEGSTFSFSIPVRADGLGDRL